MMEFNVLPRARILSPQTRHKTSQTTNQTVNVILPQQQQQQPASKPDVQQVEQSTELSYPPTPPSTAPAPETENEYDTNPYKTLEPGVVDYRSRDVVLDESAEKITQDDSIATINFLKLVVQAYMSNPIKYNGYVICSVSVLENLIETLTSCENCSIDVADVETGCCGVNTKHIVPITKIWVRNGDTNEIFKYRYSQFLQTFEQYNISLKFAYIE